MVGYPITLTTEEVEAERAWWMARPDSPTRTWVLEVLA